MDTITQGVVQLLTQTPLVSTITVLMLDVNWPSPVLDYQGLAQVFVRYACELELNEREVDLIMSNRSFTAVEPEFLGQYVNIVRQRACERMAQLSRDLQLKKPSVSELFGDLWKVWKETVITPTLSQITLLTAEGEAYLRTIFATIVREFVGSARLVEIIVEDTRTPLESLHILVSMGLTEECNAVLASKLPVMIREYLHTHWASKYSGSTIDTIDRWLKSSLIPQVAKVLGTPEAELPVDLILDLAMGELARLRIAELYTIVEHEIKDGLSDLAQGLSRCRYLRDSVVHTFTAQCRRKLLNGASDTVDIILMYLKTFRAFSVIDPQGVLLERVSTPIRVALKDRSDTSAKLAEGIFGDPNSPLAFLSQELQDQNARRRRPRGDDYRRASDVTMSDGPRLNPQHRGSSPPRPTRRNPNQQFRDWQPDPIDTPTYFVRKQAQDQVNTLINLYDNKEVFVQQFVKLFGAELLRASFEESETIDRLEDLNYMLGQRFGESNMLKTGVMLHDVRNSHRIADQIHARNPGLKSISALVLSRLYWPSLPQTPQPVLPERFQELVDGYASQFRDLSEYKNQDLHWLPHHGRVSVTLSMKEREITVVVRPHEAVLISAFDDASLSLGELADRTHLEEPLLLEAIQFWVDQLVLAPDGENYKVLETLAEVEDQQRLGSARVVTSSEVLGGQSAKAVKDPFEDMHIYWSYIVGMLTNLGALPVEKIHSFLVMFVPSEDPYVKTKQQLENYLLAMVDEGKLKIDDSKFSLVPK